MVRSLIWSAEPLRVCSTTYWRNVTDRLLDRKTSSRTRRSSWARIISAVNSTPAPSSTSIMAVPVTGILAFQGCLGIQRVNVSQPRYPADSLRGQGDGRVECRFLGGIWVRANHLILWPLHAGVLRSMDSS